MFTRRQIWALLLPLMAEQVLTSFMGAVDTIMVTTAGSAAISAVSLVDSINVLIILVFSALATGGATLCAQYLGRKRRDKASETGRQLVVSVFALSLLVSLACFTLREPILRLIFGRTDPEIMRNALVYFQITALSFPFIALYDAGAALFRAGGNARLPLAISVASNLLNVGGNAILIFGLGMGVAGAALATLFSRIVCALGVLFCLRQERHPITVRDYLHFRPDPAVIWSILSIGVPTGIESGMFQFGKLAIQSTISTMSTAAIAAQAMTSTLEVLGSHASLGIGLGMMTIVGQCIGAGQVEEARKEIRRLTWYGFWGITICSALILLAVRPVTQLSGMEPAAAELTCRLTWLVNLAKPLLWPLAFLPVYGMKAAGDVRFAMLFSTFSMWVFRVALCVWLVNTYHMGPVAVWIGMFLDWGVRSLVYTLRFRSGHWLNHPVLRPEPPRKELSYDRVR